MTYTALPQSDSSLELPQWRDPVPRRSKYSPASSIVQRFGKLGATGMFFGTAALSGCLLYLVVLVFFSGPPAHDPNSKYMPAPPEGPPYPPPEDNTAIHTVPDPIVASPSEAETHAAAHTSPVAYEPVAPPLDYHELSLEDLRDHVAQTNGYFVRDWSLGLGWNMRYIIEAAFLHAQLLNRTLVMPSFVYARACEYGLDACAEYAEMVNKGDMVHSDEWRNLPYEKQMNFRIPIQLMLNITRMREVHPVILVSDYLRLHGLSSNVEATDGRWQRGDYHVSPPVFPSSTNATADSKLPPSLFVVENHQYDPRGSSRVDRIPDDMKQRGAWSPEGVNAYTGARGHWAEALKTSTTEKLHNAEQGSATLEWDKAKEIMREVGSTDFDLDTDEGVEMALRANGWETLYTFNSVLGMEFTRTVVDPIRQAVPRTSVRGWADEYGSIDADVLLLAGETHLSRKSGGVRFTTPEARTAFQGIVLHHVVPVDGMLALAERLAMRMRERVGGRMWMGAHMRRGDFVREGWVMEKDPLDHVNRVRQRLDNGRKILEDLKDIKTYPVPDVQPNVEQLTLSPPQPDDPFYAATDERDPEALKVIASHGAVFLSDVLTMADRRAFGWPLMITDVRAVLEQSLLAHSAYFYAHAMSSVAGGIVNMRAAHGADPRTELID